MVKTWVLNAGLRNQGIQTRQKLWWSPIQVVVFRLKVFPIGSKSLVVCMGDWIWWKINVFGTSPSEFVTDKLYVWLYIYKLCMLKGISCFGILYFSSSIELSCSWKSNLSNCVMLYQSFILLVLNWRLHALLQLHMFKPLTFLIGVIISESSSPLLSPSQTKTSTVHLLTNK